MTDVLIPDVPVPTVQAIDANAKSVGLSRSEYLRRWLDQFVPQERRAHVTQADLERTAEVFQDVLDPEVMAGAWR